MENRIKTIGHISTYVPSMNDWHPIRYINEIKHSEQLKIEKNKLFKTNNNTVSKVIEISQIFTNLSFKEILNIEDLKENKYCGIIAYYLNKYHNYTVEEFVYDYGLPKSTYSNVKSFKSNIKKYKYKSFYYYLIINYEKFR